MFGCAFYCNAHHARVKLWVRRLTEGTSASNIRESLNSLSGVRVRLSSMIDQKLLEILVCPIDKQPLEDYGDYLVNPRLNKAYPVQDDIPVMLVDEAKDWPIK